MNRKTLIILGIAGVLLVTLFTAAFVGRNILTEITHGILPVYASQENEPDPEAGLIVTSVVKGGPSDEAGIVRGDILLRLNEKEVNSMEDLHNILADFEGGEDVQLTVLHGDDVLTFTVRAEDGPSRGQLGLALCCGLPLEKDMVVFELDKGKPLIIRIVKDSPAEEAGLKVGDLILELDGQKLDEEDDLAELIRNYKPGDQIELEVERIDEDKKIEFTIELAEHPKEDGVAFLGVHIIKAPSILSLPLGEGNLEDYHFNFPFLEEDWFLLRPWHGDDTDRRFRPFIDGWVLPLIEEGDLSGIVITKVISNSPAALAGLHQGDLIVSVNGHEIEDPDGFTEKITSLDPGEAVQITLHRDDLSEALEISVILGEHPDKPGAGYLGIKIGAMIRIDRTIGGHRFDRWMPQFDFDRFHLPFQFEWRFDLPGSKDV